MGVLKFYDTNALLSLKEKVFDHYFVISSITLQELEDIKTNRNKDDEIKYCARTVVRLLHANREKYDVVIYDEDVSRVMHTVRIEESPDIKIIACAKHLSKEQPIVFVTDDILCSLIAENIFELHVEQTGTKCVTDTYTGFKEVALSDEEMACFYENLSVNSFNLLVNEYLIVKNKHNDIVDKLRWNGNTHQPIKISNMKSNYFGVIKPYNGDVYQQLVLNSLSENQITMIKGHAGTGKSYLALGFMFNMLEKKKIDKIIIFANPIPTMNSAKIGFLPGTQLDKLIDSSVGNMLASKLGDKYAIEQLVSQNKLSILPMCDIRGFDTTGLNCAVYITEAQNMDISLMKLALQRIGDDSICIIEGDCEAQVDLGQYAGTNNGMRRMSEVFRGQDFYGEVELQNIYRSRIAKIAELM